MVYNVVEMPDTAILTLDGKQKALASDDVSALAAALHGELITPEAPGYDEARAVWNAMIDRRPALIARCRGVSDVLHAVRFARDHEALVAIQGGGHNIAGNGVCEGGLLIDLSPMRDVRVDPGALTARVGPGALLQDFDREAQAFGLATPLGINSTTGVGGLTLGGGFGWLSRKHGMTIDNLRSADIVTADGELVVASEDEEPDLFWGIRGGGGNLGVATSFEFDLHPLGPTVLSGLVVHPFDDAAGVLRHYRDFVDDMSDDLNVWFVLRQAPPLPFLPEDVHGNLIVILAAFYAGDMAEGERRLEPLRAYGSPIADVIGPHPYTGWQAAFDPLGTPGVRNYWKSHNFDGLSDDALDALIGYATRLPSAQSEIFVARLGGAINRLPPDATAYPHRDPEFLMNVHTRWEDPGDDDRCTGWAREVFEGMAPFSKGGVYVNFIPEDEERVPEAYGTNLDRLASLKARYDPGNLFRMNQNVRPAEEVGV